MFCAIACVNSMLLHQLDFERAFAYAPVEEDIYVRPHPEMRAPDGTVYKLRKSLYGLKQAPRNWNEYLNDICLYTRKSHGYVVPWLTCADKGEGRIQGRVNCHGHG